MTKILVVDDDRSILRVAETVLKRNGYDVVATTQPEQAVDIAASEGADAIVLDVMMPNKSGFSVLEDLRGKDETAGIPVLMLSSLSTGKDRVRGLRFGADDYMLKPLEPEELVLRLERLLSLTSDATAALGGSLADFSLQEILHNLYQSSRAGTLYVEAENTHGLIDISDGFLGHAHWRHLRGSDAVMAMMRIRNGRFRFEPSPPLNPPLKSGDALGSLMDIVMRAAWIEDELYSRPGLRPHSKIFFEHEPDTRFEVPNEFRQLPLDETLTLVKNAQGITLLDLVDSAALAPQRLCLAVAVLQENGILRVETTD